MSSLRTFQQELGTVLLTLDGHGILDDEDRWQACRDQYPGIAEIPRDKLKLYTSLIRSGIHGTMEGFFPATKRFYTDKQWRQLAELYRRSCPNPSFQLFRSVKQLPDFLATLPLEPPHPDHPDHELAETVRRFPFLPEIARYEWLEAELRSAPDIEPPDGLESRPPESAEELSQYRPCWNPAGTVCAFRFPVPDILEQLKGLSDENLEKLSGLQPHPTEILVYRDVRTLGVRYFKLNPLTAMLLKESRQAPSCLAALDTLHQNVSTVRAIPRDVLLAEGLKLFRTCHDAGILAGIVLIG